jgi:MFS family permease
LGGFLFLNTLYLQDVRQLSALHAGLYTLPMAAMTVLLAPVSGRITGRRGPRIPLLVAGVMTTGGALLLASVTATTPVGWLMLAYVAFGAGNGMVNPPISNTAVSGMPRAQAGVAAAVASTSRQVGVSLGVALAGSVVASALHGPMRTGFVHASHAGWLIIAGFGALVFVAGLVTTGRWAQATAARTASRLMSGEPKVPIGTSLTARAAPGRAGAAARLLAPPQATARRRGGPGTRFSCPGPGIHGPWRRGTRCGHAGMCGSSPASRYRPITLTESSRPAADRPHHRTGSRGTSSSSPGLSGWPN